ncbi:MAG: tRNA1(Val) (adenine(37)-N6)-methyltransferase [Lachnospiraceae bacterium]|nr:tRNA1(Val) (adenine(37)-N6)-methyltransferase [Lachnospiraceae bacterium]
METIIKEGERLDDLQRNGYQIIQNPGRFCFGMDAVLLSAFTRVRRGEQVVDLGTGTGIIPILLAARTEGTQFTGLEIQKESADMARRSVRLNDLEERIQIVDGDIREADHIFGAACCQVVVSNPPYMIAEHGLLNEDGPLAIARHEILCTLEDVVAQAARLLKPGGRFYLVHRPFRLSQIMTTLSAHRLEPKRMRLVYPFIDKDPNMVLIEAVDGGRPGLTVEKPLIVYRGQGKYTDEIYEIYGKELPENRG